MSACQCCQNGQNIYYASSFRFLTHLLGILTSKQLLDMGRAGFISQHPILGRSCYAEPAQSHEIATVEVTPSAFVPEHQSDFI